MWVSLQQCFTDCSLHWPSYLLFRVVLAVILLEWLLRRACFIDELICYFVLTLYPGVIAVKLLLLLHWRHLTSVWALVRRIHVVSCFRSCFGRSSNVENVFSSRGCSPQRIQSLWIIRLFCVWMTVTGSAKRGQPTVSALPIEKDLKDLVVNKLWVFGGVGHPVSQTNLFIPFSKVTLKSCHNQIYE